MPAIVTKGGEGCRGFFFVCTNPSMHHEVVSDNSAIVLLCSFLWVHFAWPLVPRMLFVALMWGCFPHMAFCTLSFPFCGVYRVASNKLRSYFQVHLLFSASSDVSNLIKSWVVYKCLGYRCWLNKSAWIPLDSRPPCLVRCQSVLDCLTIAEQYINIVS